MPETTLRDAQRVESRRAEIATSIADLDEELATGDITAEDHAALREKYIGEMARLLREDTDPQQNLEPPRPKRPRRPSHHRRRWVLVAAVCCIAAGATILAGVLATGSTSDRLPGESASGSLSLSASQQVSRSLQQAQTLEEEGDFSEALQVYRQVLARDPHQPEATAYSGWILQLAAEANHGNAKLDAEARSDEEAAVASAPTYPDARYFLGTILYEDYHDASDAVTQFRQFLADSPSASFLADAAPVVKEAYIAAGQPVPPQVGS